MSKCTKCNNELERTSEIVADMEGKFAMVQTFVLMCRPCGMLFYERLDNGKLLPKTCEDDHASWFMNFVDEDRKLVEAQQNVLHRCNRKPRGFIRTLFGV